MQKTSPHFMDPCYFRCCCCPRLHQFHRRQVWVLLARKSQSRHLAFEIHSLLHRMPSRFLHHRILEILGLIGQRRSGKKERMTDDEICFAIAPERLKTCTLNLDYYS
ncbi:UNVERIFIED_CONTAM: hypothetical protein NCL1_31498 [Trichonephila clavipes]